MEYSVQFIPFVLIFFISLIFYFKSRRYHKQEPHSSSKKVSNRTKYPEANVFKDRPVFLKMGLALSLSFVLMAFSWTTYTSEIEYIPMDYSLDEIEQVPPRTPPVKRTPPPPPPPPKIVEVPNEVPVEEPVFIPLEVTPDTKIEHIIPEPVKEKSPIVPPPPPEEVEVEEIFSVVEEMPRFPGCDSGSKNERRKCSDEKLLKYLARNLKYPNVARDNGIEGRLYVRFIVHTDGSIQDAVVMRDIGGGCGEAALKVVNDMNNLPQKWTPGKQRGRKVKVMYTLPVNFALSH